MAKRIGLVGVSILATLLGLEIGLRLVHPVPLIVDPRDFYSPDPHAWYVLKPNTVRTVKMREFTFRMEMNSRGFRGPEFSGYPAPATTRVLLLGDSFTFGWGVDFESTYGRVLERSLNGDPPGERFEVINAGVPGYNTLNELRFLETRGVTLKPRFVVLQLLIDDDVRANLVDGVTHRTVIGNTLFRTATVDKVRSQLRLDRTLTAQDVMAAEAADAPARPLYERLKAPLHNHSHFYRFVIERIRTPQVEQLKRFLRGVGFDIQQDDTEMLPRWQLEVFEKPRPARINEAVTITQEYLRQLKSVADAHDAQLLVVIFPTMLEVDATSRARLLERFGLAQNDIDVEGVKNELLTFCRQMGIPGLELQPVVRARYSEVRPYFPIDGHFNARGNRLAGEAVADFLRCVTRSPGSRCSAVQGESARRRRGGSRRGGIRWTRRRDGQQL